MSRATKRNKSTADVTTIITYYRRNTRVRTRQHYTTHVRYNIRIYEINKINTYKNTHTHYEWINYIYARSATISFEGDGRETGTEEKMTFGTYI